MSSGSIFDHERFRGAQGAFLERQKRIQRYWAYYKGTVYNAATAGGGVPAAVYLNGRIASTVRPLFTPLARAVNLDVALIPAGWLLRPDVLDEERDFINRLWRSSDWNGVTGDLLVRYLVATGEAGIWLSWPPGSDVPRLQAVRGDRWVMYGDAVLLMHSTGPDEVVDVVGADRWQHWVGGRLVKESENAFGEIPFVSCVNESGEGYGEPTFEDAIASLDQVNLQATHLANIIQKHVEPQWAAFGAEPADLEKSGDSVWFFPDGSDVKAVLAQVDFDGVLAFIQEIKSEVKDALPELSLTRLVGSERVAAATIELQMAESVFKVRRLRKPVDAAVDRAIEMAARIARQLGGVDVPAMQSVEGWLDVDRPVLQLDAMTRVQLEQAQIARDSQREAARQHALLMQGGA
jgi:hypothetical protein